MKRLEREALCRALVKPLNQMAKDQNKTQIVAATAQEITFKELMQLSESQLLELEKKVQSAKSAKETNKREEQYYKTHGFTLQHTETKKFNIK